MKKKELVLFETADNAIKLEVPVEGETVWLSANQMAVLFDRDDDVEGIERNLLLYSNNTHFLRVVILVNFVFIKNIR